VTLTIPDRLRASRRARDAAPAAALAVVFVAAPAFGPRGWTSATAAPALLAVTSCLPLLVRSRWPLAVLAATLALDVLRITLTPQHEIAPAAVLVALYTLASRRGRTVAWPTGIASAAVITAAYAVAHGETWTSGIVLGLFDLPLLATALGDTVRSRRAYLAEAEARAERAERTREQEARRAVTEERLRIARELHDVTAHHITLVNAQAGVAHHLMRDNPEAAYQALGQIKETSRAALDDLRATVGLLRQPDDDPAPLRPLPALGDLDKLISAFRASGSQVDLGRRGTPVPAAAGTQLAAYRIIQEALTNACRHAPGARVRVLLEYCPGSLHITVANEAPRSPDPKAAADTGTGTGTEPASAPGAGRLHGHSRRRRPGPARAGTADSAAPFAGTGAEAGPGTGTGTGHGLIGMRERATALGGTVTAGRDPAGGYQVRAELPLSPATPAEPAAPAAPAAHAAGDAIAGKGNR
jgi:signal transduction histidine kinase